jgi:hypothetical protein
MPQENQCVSDWLPAPLSNLQALSCTSPHRMFHPLVFSRSDAAAQSAAYYYRKTTPAKINRTQSGKWITFFNEKMAYITLHKP